MAPIHLACRVGSTHSIKAIFYWSSDHDRHTIQHLALDDGRIPIHIACQHGHLEAVKALVEEMMDPPRVAVIIQARNALNQWNALHYASHSGHLHVVKYLVETHNVRIENLIQNPLSVSPLDCAAKEGHGDVVRYLVEQAGAGELLGQSSDSSALQAKLSPLDWATKRGHVDIVQYLLTKGSTPTARTLHLGADQGSKMLRVLVRSLPKSSTTILSAVVDYSSLFHCEWLSGSFLMTNRRTSFAEVCRDHRHWRTWNLLALILHRFYFSNSSAEVPPLYQLSNQVDAKVTVSRKIARPVARPLPSNLSAIEGTEDRSNVTTQSCQVGVPHQPPARRDGDEYEEVVEIVEFENSKESDFSWMLHAAASMEGAPSSVIFLLAGMFPSQLGMRHRGFTPLLLACRSSCRMDTIATLIECDPRTAAIRESTQRGYLPLAAAMSAGNPPAVLTQIIRAYPPALLELDGAGWSSLRVAAYYADLSSFYWYLRNCPAMALDVLKRLEND
jgi:hypothetical protein